MCRRVMTSVVVDPGPLAPGSQAMEWLALLENGGSFPIFGVEGRLYRRAAIGLEFLYDLPRCELVNDVSCRFPLYVLPPQSWSGNEAAIFGVDHIWSGSELFGDGLELWLDIGVWDHVLQEVQDLVVGPVVL